MSKPKANAASRPGRRHVGPQEEEPETELDDNEDDAQLDVNPNFGDVE